MKYVYLLIVLCFFLCVGVEAQINGKYGPAEAVYRMMLWQSIPDGPVLGQLYEPMSLLLLGNNTAFRYRQSYQWAITDDLIPDGSTINSVRLIFNGFYGNFQSYFTAGFSNIELDIQDQDYPGVWSQITDPVRALGAEDSDPPPDYDFDHTFTSGSAFCTAVQNALNSDKFILGIMYTGEYYSNWWFINNSSVTIEVDFTRPHVTVEQKLSEGEGNSIGDVGKWNGESFEYHNAPHTFVVPIDLPQTFRADSNVYENQKYDKWRWGDNADDFIIHHSFGLPLPSEILSAFKPTNGNITIKHELLDGPTAIGSDNIEFYDPWLIDTQDPLFGNARRNRGTSATFLPRESPFNPGFQTASDGNVHRGVFLDENLGWDPEKPIYKIRMPQTQYFNEDYSSWFIGWKVEGSTLVQEPNNRESSVIFKGANDVVKAKYKGHLITSNASNTGKNSQRKIVRDGSGFYHMVYESGGEIWYTKSTNGGTTWTNEIMLSEEYDSKGTNIRNPSLCSFTVGSDRILQVVWIDNQPEGLWVVFHKSINDIWGTFYFHAHGMVDLAYDSKPVVDQGWIAYDYKFGTESVY